MDSEQQEEMLPSCNKGGCHVSFHIIYSKSIFDVQCSVFYVLFQFLVLRIQIYGAETKFHTVSESKVVMWSLSFPNKPVY